MRKYTASTAGNQKNRKKSATEAQLLLFAAGLGVEDIYKGQHILKRDEAHRFAQHYHHILRNKKIIGKNH
jgi:excinuclease UvrABC nuclease subunit